MGRRGAGGPRSQPRPPAAVARTTYRTQRERNQDGASDLAGGGEASEGALPKKEGKEMGDGLCCPGWLGSVRVPAAPISDLVKALFFFSLHRVNGV